MIEKNPFIEKILSSKSSESYDCAVMFSGGKDSTFLLYLLKKVYNKNVVAVTVNNGFEPKSIWENIRSITEKLDVPHVVYEPGSENFRLMFNSMITEYELFWKYNTNHICFTCNNVMSACVLKYAAENGIPFIVSGLEIAQLNSGRTEELKIDENANSIAEKSCKAYLQNSLSAFRKSVNYKNIESFRYFIDETLKSRKNVKTIYPFIYLRYDVSEIKDFLESEIGWKPPVKIKKEDYFSSGCVISDSIFGVIEKLDIIKLMERDEIKRLIKNNGLEKKYLSYFSEIDNTQVFELSDNLFEDLQIKDFIINKCKEKNIPYKT